jgi:hypothetical protein
LVEDLQCLRVEPLRGDLAAVPREPGFAALAGDGVDAIGLGLRRKSGIAQSGVPSAVVGSIVHAVKSMPMPMTSAGSTPDCDSTQGTATWKVRM